MPLLKLWAGSLVMLAAVSLPLQAASPVKVGSKIDTEGALLGNIILQVLESHGVPTVNKVHPAELEEVGLSREFSSPCEVGWQAGPPSKTAV